MARALGRGEDIDRRGGRLAFWRRRPAPTAAERAQRMAVQLEVTILSPTGAPMAGIADNLSATGFRARLPVALPVGMLIRVSFREGHARHARIVRQDGEMVGCQFIGLMPDEELETLWAASGA